ncbi:MAG TPA: M67 family metallopeptidase [Promineifilum sp.]|nr:M67 family metallopeptidase [Promineifilum sp.]
MDEIHLPAGLHEAMIRRASDGYPEEICGLLAGAVDDRLGRAMRLYPVENALHSPVAYEMEPSAQVRAMIAIESEGLELVAIYHSHPTGPAAPSRSDIAQALYPDTAQIIISLADRSQPTASAYLIRDDRATEIRLVMI